MGLRRLNFDLNVFQNNAWPCTPYFCLICLSYAPYLRGNCPKLQLEPQEYMFIYFYIWKCIKCNDQRQLVFIGDVAFGHCSYCFYCMRANEKID